MIKRSLSKLRYDSPVFENAYGVKFMDHTWNRKGENCNISAEWNLFLSSIGLSVRPIKTARGEKPAQTKASATRPN